MYINPFWSVVIAAIMAVLNATMLAAVVKALIKEDRRNKK